MVDSDFGSHYLSLALNKPKRPLTPLSIGFLKLQFLFDIEKFTIKLWIIGLVSIFAGIYNFFLLERTGLYSLGINSVFQSIARCISYFLKKNKFEASAKALHNIMFWVMSLLINIPLAIMGYRKIGKKFTFLTIFFVVISSITSIIFSLLSKSFGFKDFYIFSDPRTFNSCLINEGINILHWNYVSIIPNNGSQSIAMNDSSRVVLIFWYGLFFGLLNTLTSIVIYALGGSTGGMDWIIFYFSKKHAKMTPNLYLYMGLLITFFAYLIGTYVPYADHMFSSGHKCDKSENNSFNDKNHSVISSLLGPMFVATTIAAFTRRIFFSIFYPHFKFINVKIFTNKFLEFRKVLLSSDFPHSFTITSSIGGYLLRSQMVFEVTCLSLELKTLKEYAEKIDPGCLIIATPIKSLNGKFFIKDHLN